MQQTTQGYTRRTILKAGALLTACVSMPGLAHASTSASFRTNARALSLINPHTGDKLKTVYWEKGSYSNESLKDISYIMRDMHTGEMSPIDPRLIDILYSLRAKLETSKPFEIVCGYRTPRSNAFIYKHEKGVGKNSYHMYGRAVDIRLADRSASQIQHAAWSLQKGGVGYYPKAGFVHIDTGGIRRW